MKIMNVICGSAVKMKRGHPWRDVWRRRREQVVVLGSRGAVKVPPRHSKKNCREKWSFHLDCIYPRRSMGWHMHSVITI